jgi:PhzF family phenazine biosynthesis protein
MKVFIVNAFTTDRFGGNPAAVVPLDQWIDPKLMQQIAFQHNLSETAFVVRQGEDFSIRWFTPTVEVDLCGHATLTSAHVFFNHLDYQGNKITFQSKSGPLPVTKQPDGKITLDFPSLKTEQVAVPEQVPKGLKIAPQAVYSSRFDYLVLLQRQRDVENLSPDFEVLSTLESRGIIVTAKGDQTDFVSRCFFPQSGIDEDPATGSAHAVLAGFWAERLGKTSLSALQLSARKGWLDCEYRQERTLISGFAVTYLQGDILT